MPTLEVQKTKKGLSAKARMAIAVAVGLVLAAALWGLWQWHVSADEAAYKKAAATGNLAGLSRDYAGAAKAWSDYRKGMPPRRYDFESYLNQGALEETMQKYPQALASYREAEKVHKGNGTAEYVGIARVSERLNDLPTAIEYYKKAGNIYVTHNQGRAESDWMFSHAENLKKRLEAGSASN